MGIPNQLTIVLTGSTGNLGVYLLDVLRSLPYVRKVYCLNRSRDAAERQAAGHRARGVSDEWTDEIVQFVHADFARERFGLHDCMYEHLAQVTDLIIHNAWPVDFNRHFSSFEPSIQGVQNFLAFSRHRIHLTSHDDAEPAIPLLFISSIGAVSNWGSHAPTARATVPEVEMTDWKLSRTGYGQSKLLAERLIAHAARGSSSEQAVPASIARVGQLGGPVQYGTHGSWPEREWLPSLLRSSLTLRVLPKDLGPASVVDWVPVDVAARVIAELGLHTTRAARTTESLRRRAKSEAEFFHVVNPSHVTWNSLLPTIQKHMPASTREISFIEWVEQLRISAESLEGIDTGTNPAAKLLHFFESLQDRAIRFPKSKAAELESKRTVQISGALARLLPVQTEWMDLWMRQWGWNVAPSF